MSAAQFSALHPLLLEKNVTMIGIGVEALGYESFVEGKFFTGDLFVDEAKAAYLALSCQRNTWRNFWGIFDGEIMRLFNLSKKRGFDNNMKGDTNSLGGTFLLQGTTGGLMYGHYQTPKSFEPSMGAIAEALKLHLPDDYDPYAVGAAVKK